MRCPMCGSTFDKRKTTKGVLFLVCSRWPECHVSGTPELIEHFRTDRTRCVERDVTKLGDLTEPLAKLRILQSQLRSAKTEEDRERIRTQAKEVIR